MKINLKDSRLCYELFRLGREPGSTRATIRRWYWIFVRRWETEICGFCGRPVCERDLSWWWAPNALWEAAGRLRSDIRCPSCFTEECRRAGYAIHWQPVVDYELCKSCLLVPESCICKDAGFDILKHASSGLPPIKYD